VIVGETKLLGRAEHALGEHAADASLLEFGRARNVGCHVDDTGTGERDGDLPTHLDVQAAGDDCEAPIAGIDLDDDLVIGVRVRLDPGQDPM
jgi:hypothetical protein